MRPKRANPGIDAVLARVAARQHGVISLAQLMTIVGLSPRAISHRVAAGRLHRLHRGIYAVGHAALSNEGKWLAAVLACGPDAVLSHRPAAEHWGMLKVRDGVIHVTIPSTGGRRRRAGICLHRSPSLTSAAATVHNGIRITSPARTIADLRQVATVDELRQAIREAEFRKLNIGDERGTEPDLTRNPLERRFLGLCRRHGLAAPEVNAMIGSFEVDFLWRDRRLIVETDGYRSHGTRSSFESDRARDVELKLLGYEVVRFTWSQVTQDGPAVAAALRALLAR